MQNEKETVVFDRHGGEYSDVHDRLRRSMKNGDRAK